MKRNNSLKSALLTISLITINFLNISIGFSIWDRLEANTNQNTIRIGIGTSLRFFYSSQNFGENDLLIAENMAMRTSEDVNTSIATTYTIELVVKDTSEIITPYIEIDTGETWFAEVKIANVSIVNNGVDVTAEGSGALRFTIDFLQASQTIEGTPTVVDDFNLQNELVESVEIINNGTYIATQFEVHLSIINWYTDAHSIALHGANVSYEIELEITQNPETMA